MKHAFHFLALLTAALPLAAAEQAPAGAAPAAQAVEDAGDEAAAEEQQADVARPDDPGFERYKTITDRMPFGPEPANFDPDSRGGRGGAAAGVDAVGADEAAQAEEAQRILSAVRVSALNVTPRGAVAVGFTDSSKQPAASYYLKVGETRDGWTVKEADAKEMTVTLERDGVEATLKLGEGTDGKDGKKGGGAAPGGRMAASGGRPMPGVPGGMRQPPRMFGGRMQPGASESAGDALARLRARRDQKMVERQAAADRAAAAAELAEAEHEKAAAARERAAAEREQTRLTIQQIQEELRRQREARQNAAADGGGDGGGDGDGGGER